MKQSTDPRRDYRSVLNMVNDKLNSTEEKSFFHALGVTELFDTCELLIETDEAQQAIKLLNLLSNRGVGHARVKVLQAELYYGIGRYEDARTLYEELASTFAKETFFTERALECDFSEGQTESFFSRIKEKINDQLAKAGIVEIGKSISSPALRRQLARALWLQGEWQDALQVYKDLELVLESKVSDFVKRLENEHRQQIKELAIGSFWDFVISGSRKDMSLLDSVMSPDFMANHLGTEMVRELAGIYSSYRWLEVVKKEYEAKQALNNKSFYQAAKEYEALIEEEEFGADVYPDLATIYSRLGRHAKETEMIEKIKEIESVYPGMKTTLENNVRQRRPHIYFDGRYLFEEGRDGLKDIEKTYSGLGVRVQPTISQQFGLDAGWINYRGNGDLKKVESLSLQGAYSLFLNDFLEIGGEIGLEDLSTSNDPYLKYDFFAKGTPEESVELHFGVSQQLVADNLEALEQGIYRRQYGCGLIVDPIPSLFMGFDFDLIKYSDSNDGKIFNVWTSYKLFTDTSRFDFSYRYQKVENDIVNKGEASSGYDDFPSLLSYWSPEKYWRHLLSFEYRRELWPSGKFYSGTSWVSAMYGIGYESYESVVHMFEANIFLEIHPMFLLKGTFILDRAEGYDRNEGFLSLAYRW